MNGRSVAMTVGALPLAIACVLIGRSTVARDTSPVRLAPETRDRSAIGAVAAAAEWMDASDTRAEVLDAAHRDAIAYDLIAPESRARLGGELDRAAASLARARSGPPSPVVRSAGLGYRVRRFAGDRAVVDAWEVVTRSALDVPPSLLWSVSSIRLRWEGSWRVTDARSRLKAPQSIDAAQLAAMDREYRSFRRVP